MATDPRLEMNRIDPSANRRVTLRDVADRVGVARSTVSRAITSPDRVHPATRERVLQAAAEVGYSTTSRPRPDAGLRRSIALLIPDIANPFYAELTRGAQMQINAAGLTQYLADTEESATAEERAVRQVSRMTDGIILAATRLSDDQLRAASPAIPLVMINREFEGFSSVCLDTAMGIRQTVEHLASLGHRRLAYLSGPNGSWSDALRWSALENAVRGSDISAVKLGPFTPTLESGAAAADAALGSDAQCCIAYNDLLAIGVLHRLGERGVGVPTDFSVAGCDDICVAGFCNPSLTTISGDLQRVGRTAVQLLLALLDDPDRPRETVTLPTHLKIRSSTGRPLR